MHKKIDFLVIGGGSGGVRAARLSASFGAKVVLIEKSQLGGTCVNLGCVPKKFFVYASDFRHQFKTAQGYGWDVQSKLNWQKFIANILESSRNQKILANSIPSMSGKKGFPPVAKRILSALYICSPT